MIFVRKPIYGSIMRMMSTVCNKETKYLPQSLIKLRRIQMHYQREDGKPIWLKGGMSDYILYNSTLVLCVIGLLSCCCFVYDHAKPPTWRSTEDD